MRNVFNTLAKIIGVWVVVLGVRNLSRVFSYIAEAEKINDIAGGNFAKGDMYIFLCAIQLISAGLFFILAWVLIFKTDWVANRLKVPKDENTCQPLERSALFPMGIQLLGLYVALEAIPFFMSALYSSFGIPIWKNIAYALPRMVQICLAMICVFKADVLAKFITEKATVQWLKIVAIVLLVFGFVILIFQIAKAMSIDAP